MPLPFILGGAAVVAGAAGIGSGIKGAKKMKEAQETLESAQRKHKRNIRALEECNEETTKIMDDLGKLELETLKSFERFSDVIEKIQNRPEFKEYYKDGVRLPKYNKKELKEVSVGAGVLLGGLGGAAVGTAGGFAAAGATTTAVMALGTASTGTAISSLSGAALTNATLAALGGGALNSSVFAGGMALGSTVLGAATLGAGLLVGGVIFNATGSKLSEQADEAYAQMRKAARQMNEIKEYLMELQDTASDYIASVKQVRLKYTKYLNSISYTVEECGKTDWNQFTQSEKLATQNLVLLVGLLYKMCQVNLVKKSNNENDMNTINKEAVSKSIENANRVLDEVA